MSSWQRRLLKISGISGGFLLVMLTLIWVTTDHHQELEEVAVECASTPPVYDSEKPLKVLSWNIQFLAGKNYVFFYDAVNGSGTDEAPSAKDQQLTLGEVVRVLKEENPDIVLLQEVDVGAKRTDYADQVQILWEHLGKKVYPCAASTYYWKAGFAPHPHIMGRIGMKLATFSKYQIQKAWRHALGEFPANIVVRQFRPKRAILETQIPSNRGPELHIMNTHLEAYSQGSDLMKKQIEIIKNLLQRYETNPHSQEKTWLLGGDFNLLLPGGSYESLSPSQRSLYQKDSEIKSLTDHYAVIPSLRDVNGELKDLWYTHYPNDPEVQGPDRTIDYLFYGTALQPRHYKVRSHDTQKISDHLPVIGEFRVKSIVSKKYAY